MASAAHAPPDQRRIAHDFNNLLTVIVGYSDLLLRGLAPGDPRRKSMEIIPTTAERASQLTRQLLAFSRKQVLAPTLLDLNTAVTEMTAILHRLIGASIELVFTPAEDLGLVEVDRGQIEQVIVNLVVNARDAMPDGGRIAIAPLRGDSAPGRAPRLPACSTAVFTAFVNRTARAPRTGDRMPADRWTTCSSAADT